MHFDGKVVLITGGASGIGAETVRQFAKFGAKLSIVDLNENLLNKIVVELKNAGSPTPHPILADVTKDAERIVAETIEHFGKLDILVNNAGILLTDSVEEMDMSKFDRMFDVNVRSVVNLTRLCVPHLEKTKGNIVNISSVSADSIFPSLTGYGMSKAAINHFTKAAALDLASKSIRVNAISPGVVETPIYYSSGSSPEKVEKTLQNIESQTLVGRNGIPEDITSAILYVADNKTSSFITGSIFTIDGGLCLGRSC